MAATSKTDPIRPREVEVPETFHRLKRTAILLSAGLVVLVFSTPAETQTIHLTFVDLAVPAALARGMLWLAAAYYFAGFRLEYRMVRQFNSEALDDKAGPFHAKIEEAAKRVGQIITSAEGEVGQVVGSFKQALAQLEKGLEHLAAIDQLFDPERRGAVHKLNLIHPEAIKRSTVAYEMLEKAQTELQLLAYISHINNQVVVSQNYSGRAVERVMSLSDNMEGIGKAIRKEHQRLKDLSPRIYRERRILLTWWEYRATAALFIFATAIVGLPAASWLVARVGALVGTALA